MLERTGECNQCGECCKTVNITAVRDITLRQHGNFEELKRYLSFRKIQVVGEDVAKNLLFYTILIPCSQLGPDNECLVNDSPQKPLICHRYPWAKDDITECSYTFEPADPFGSPKPLETHGDL